MQSTVHLWTRRHRQEENANAIIMHTQHKAAKMRSGLKSKIKNTEKGGRRGNDMMNIAKVRIGSCA